MHKTDREILLFDEIDNDKIEKVIDDIYEFYYQSKKKWITLFINSQGGDATAGISLLNYINNLKPNLQTVILGKASSIAVIIFLAGKKRFVFPSSVMFFHNIRQTYGTSYATELKESKSDAEMLQMYNDFYFDIILKQTNRKMTRPKLQKLLDSHARIGAEDAIKLGFAHKMI